MMLSMLPATRSVSVNPGHTALTVTRVLGQFQRQRAHQADHGVLCGAVGADIGIALQAGGRCDRDNAAMGRSFIDGSTAWMACTTPMKLTSIMRRNSAASDFAERRGFRSAGIGDQDVDRLPRRGLAQSPR